VSGVEVPPYDTILGYAAYKVESASGENRKIVDLPNSSPDQPKISEAWLKFAAK
jgi:hypothetical protein